MTNTTPILAIDIDGPLNVSAYSKAAKKRLARRGFRSITGWQKRVVRPPGSTWFPLSSLWLHPDHGAMLAEFSVEHDIELVWCSLWEGSANRVVAPVLGLPRLPFVNFHAHPERRLWKFPAVAEYAAGRPLAWLDDSFGHKRGALAASGFARARRNLPTLLHQVDPGVGLTDVDLADVESWLKTVRLAWNL
jgi:hypothetical protein